MEKNKEDEGEEVHINTMGSVSGEKEKGEETKEKDGDKIKKTNAGKKAKKRYRRGRNLGHKNRFEKEPFRFRLSPIKLA